MSRIARWKVEKTKVKVVFRLQFHATHIPQTGWDKLFISFIPADSAKATAKTTKANVRNGTCKWADPIYETTRLLLDIKTKQYDEKLYKLVVAMGSSRSSLLGEATVNLADYADAAKPSAVSLPLHGCDSGTILHVTVQLLTSKTGFREFEQQRELRERGLQTATDQSSPDESSGGRVLPSEETAINQMDKVNARVRFKEKSRELPSLEEEVGLNEEYADSAAGYDGSSNTSGSLYAEKQDTSSTHEIDSLKSTISGDLAGLGQSPQPEKGDPSDHRGTNDWVHGWGSDYSVDNDWAAAYEENSRLRGNLEVAESSILELKLEVSSLQSHADEIGAETQKFAQQLAAEIASGDQLAKEVSVLKFECSNLKDDLAQLTNSKVCPPVSSREVIETDRDHLFQGLQLRWQKGLLVMEDKLRELQNKASFGYHERDFRFLHSDFETLLGVLQELKPVTGQAFSSLSLAPSDRENVKEIREMSLHKCEQFVPGSGFDADLYQPELGMLHCLSIPGLVSHETDSLDATNAMKGKIFELLRELDESKAERESLAKKMDQMECYYEALIQELEENQRQMLGELQSLRNEHSTCLYTVSSSKAETEAMHQDLNEKILRFEEEKRGLDSLNKELERRAITAEAALKRARLNYSIAVDQLQKDLELLSFQVLSMFETNENLVRQAFVDPSQPSFQGYPEMVQNRKLDSEEFLTAKLQKCQKQYLGVTKQHTGGDILFEDLKQSLHLQEGLYRKVEEEVSEMHMVNIYMDVFSKTLQETLLEAVSDVRLMKEKIDELTQQLELSTESRDLLMQRLQTALDDVHFLNEYKATCTAKCSDMALQSQMLEENLQNVTHENFLLKQKIAEWESLVMEYQRNESKYEACAAENTELENLLKRESLENGNFRSEISSQQEELRTVKTEYDELASVKENLQNTVNILQNKLQNLLASYDKSFSELTLWSESVSRDLESKDLAGVVSIVEELQHNACEKILQLMEEKKDLVDERDTAKVSLSTAESDIVVMKQKITEWGSLMMEYQRNESKYEACAAEKTELANLLKKESLENGNFRSESSSLREELRTVKTEFDELASVKENLQNTVNFLQNKLQNLLASYDKSFSGLSLWSESVSQDLESKDLAGIVLLVEELQHNACEKILQLMEEKKDLVDERDTAKVSLSTAESEVVVMKQKFEHDIRDMVDKLDVSNTMAQKLQSQIEAIANRLKGSSEAEEIYAQQHRDLISDLDRLEVELQQLTSKNRDIAQEIMALETVDKELGKSKMTTAELAEENQTLMASLRDKTEESAILASELNSLRENLQSLHDELCDEKSLRDKLERTVTEITSQLNEKDCQLLQSDQQKSELNHLKQLVLNLELEKSNVCRLLLHCEECLAKAREESSSIPALETLLSEMHEFSMAADVRLAFTRTQYEAWVEELLRQLSSSDRHLAELHKKHLDVETVLNRCLSSEAQYVEGNSKLLTSLGSVRSELEAVIAENRVLLDTNSVMTAELEEYKKRAESMEATYCENESQCALEVERLKHLFVSSEEQFDNLMILKEELEVKVLVLQAKLDEQNSQITMLEGHNDEVMKLQNQCNELTQRLSEQIVKTEEFKNLSVHLKELKEKADAECIQAREKREAEGQPVAMQESLRIVFIKEQYETRLQELKHQLSVSKKHSEEMLCKLQDAVDEIENRNKSEASHLKKNEELGMKLLELEAELQSVISDRREKTKAYDLMKAESECSLISLECCKEEKQKLEASLQECSEEKSKIAAELTLMKELLEGSTSPMIIQKEGNDEPDKEDCMSDEPVVVNAHQKTPIAGTSGHKRIDTISCNGPPKDLNPKCLDRDSFTNCEEAEDTCSVLIDDGDHSSELINVQPDQDLLVCGGVNGIPSLALVYQENLLQTDTKHLALINDNFRAQSLKSSMDHLNKELERMKNENLLLPQEDHHYDPHFPGLQRELTQLQKANEELGSIFPMFNEYSDSGKALERVLALEIELAEALQVKKKSSIHFQSSFLRQHSDEEAVFQSFRDINELIKDMLEVKGRYGVVETELKEMHDRYSQLSLQFAEVEGERQKLMMTLKNVRASRKAQLLNRSSSTSLGDYSS